MASMYEIAGCGPRVHQLKVECEFMHRFRCTLKTSKTSKSEKTTEIFK